MAERLDCDLPPRLLRACAILAHVGIVDSQSELGERIRQTRLARALDVTGLAAACRIERSALSKVESGTRKVSALELVRIAAALRVTVPDLVFTPSKAVLSSRRPLTEAASQQESGRFHAETALDRLMRDAEQLRAVGHLPGGATVEAVRWASVADALTLARRARESLEVREGPLGAMADVCAHFGLWIEPVDAPVDGLSVTPSSGFGAAVVGRALQPGRRRATAAHELGHHLSGDEYSSDISVSASPDARERLIEAFAAELLLPTEVCRRRLYGLQGSDARRELIRICAEYRVSWSLALRASQGTDLQEVIGDSPTDADFLEFCGAKPLPDLVPLSMAESWVRACMAALRADDVTATRAAEMMRTAIASEALL